MSQMNGQHDNNHSNGPVPNHAVQSQQSPVPEGPPISDFLVQLQDYTPTIPDAVTAHYLATAGFDTADPRILRLVSLAAQKFVSEVASDALTHSKMRAANLPSKSKSGKDRKLVMTSEDLSLALADQGITVKKPPYYA